MRKAACGVCLLAWLSLQSAQAQSGSAPSREAESHLIAPLAMNTAQLRESPRTQQFICSVGIATEKCRQEISVLRRVLANYPSSELGQWNWVVVRSDYWKLLLISRGFNSGVPALTAFNAKTTFFEEALITGPPERVSDLIHIWHVDREDLLDLAVRHELGHALCGEENERRAKRNALLLEKKEPVTCKEHLQ